MNNIGNAKKLRHYQLNGATSNNLQDAENEFLKMQLPDNNGTNQDLWILYLGQGALNDLKTEFWNSIV